MKLGYLILITFFARIFISIRIRFALFAIYIFTFICTSIFIILLILSDLLVFVWFFVFVFFFVHDPASPEVDPLALPGALPI